ncbi:MAG: lamin tail domain-containing protein, partial [Flavobacteriales bacterium]|jgi:hypothetical protein
VSPMMNREWRILVDQNLAGSATNQTRIYFASNGPALSYSGTGSAGVQGYFLLLGEALSADVIRFYYDDGITTTLIASGQTPINAAFQARLKITVDAMNSWTLSADFTGGENYVEEFSIVENGLSSSTHLSIINTYTASNIDNFAFDDIYIGPIVVDLTPPNVQSVTATSLTSIDVLFNEAVNSFTGTNPAHYSIVNVGNALSASIDGTNPALVHLTTPAFNANTTYTLGVQQIADLAGNTMSLPNLIEFSFFEAVSANYRDVIFNEILADPTPSAGLPEVEFVELFNQHPTNAFNFEDWKFVNSSTEKILPAFVLEPGAHVILCDMNNVALMQPYGNVLGITAFTALTNTGDSLTLTDNTNQVIDIIVYSDDWFETDVKRDGGWSLELVNPNLPCANAANWRESIADIGGTPGSVNSQFNTTPDTTAPFVVSIEVIDTQTIYLTFSEPMDTSGWGTPGWDVLPFNSAYNGSWSAQLNALTLTMAFPISPSVYYQLQMNGITDCSGNQIVATSIDFAQGVSPQPGDIIINEIMADPDPSFGMPQAEFIEIRNNTSTLLDLGELTLNSGHFNSSITIPPNGFLVIADIEYNTAFDPSIPAAFMEGFPGLTNSGMLLELRSGEELLDRLDYDISWYRDADKIDGGWTLERINPEATCSGRYNWKASNASTGGTPGAENSVYSIAPNGSPLVVAYGALADTLLYISFSESMDTLSFEALSGDLGNGVVIANHTWNVDQDLLTVTTSTPLVPEILYTLSLIGLTDCDGNASAAPGIQFIRGYAPMPGDIIINEIMADGTDGTQTASPSVDFIELFNRTNRLIDLSRIELNNGFFENQVLLQPDSFLIITDSDSDPAQFFAYPNVAYMTDFPALTEDGTTLQLRYEGELIEALTYSKAYYNDAEKEAGGWSMERVNPDDPCNASDNWHACVRQQGSTAGRTNSTLDRSPDTQSPVVTFIYSEPQDSVTIVFNEPIQESSFYWTVNGSPLFETVPIIAGEEHNELVLHYGPMEANTIYTFTLEGITDCWGNSAGTVTGQFAAPRTPVAGDLIVNEILYDPFEGGTDFIEIYNAASYPVSLDSCAISDATSGEMNSPDLITERDLILLPGEFLILTKDGRRLAEFYPSTKSNRIFKVPGMSDFSSEDVVFLLLPDGTVSDEVAYNPDFHFSLLNSTDGVSLERLDYMRASDDQTNWHSASQSAGFATPGDVNSQVITNSSVVTELTVTPEIFSPDNDGYNDVITFSVALDEPGFVGNLYLYDSEGRLVRHLMQNTLLGDTGIVSWDGLRDDRSKAPVGVYVIYFEAFNTFGALVTAKNSCVLAHPLD